jgi:hypothetical protein
MEKDVKGKVNAFKYGGIMDCQTLGWERQSNSLRCGEGFDPGPEARDRRSLVGGRGE